VEKTRFRRPSACPSSCAAWASSMRRRARWPVENPVGDP